MQPVSGIIIISDIEKIPTMSCKMGIFRLQLIHSVTDMLTFLERPTLQERRRANRPSKIAHHHLPAIELPSYFTSNQAIA